MEILAYTSAGDTARRMSEYAAAFAATLKAQPTGLVIEIDFIDYAEIARQSTYNRNMRESQSILGSGKLLL